MKGRSGSVTPSIMFALRVEDSSDAVQILLAGADAESFLGATAAELLAGAACRERAQARLQACRDLNLLCEYKVRSTTQQEALFSISPFLRFPVFPFFPYAY